MISFNQFMTNTNGKAVTYDNVSANYGQCEQLVCLYWEQVYGFKCPLIPYAKDLINNPTVLASFNVVAVGQEQVGDVAVFGASTTINSPVAGHTDIVLGPISGGFTGWDSNWGGVTDQNQGTSGYGYPAAHQVTHNYGDVIGFLRFKGGNVDNLTEAEYDGLARRVLTLGMFMTVEGSAPDRQPTTQEVTDAINGLKSDPIAYIDYLTNTTPWEVAWNKVKHYNGDVANASSDSSGYTAYNGPQLFTKE